MNKNDNPTRKILVADDELHIVRIVWMKLTNAGCQVVTALDGQEALTLAQEQQPDLIITDYQMPIMSGMELARCLAKEPNTRGIPIIMLTARGFALSDDQLAGSGIKMVMTKPFSPKELLAAVNDLLSEKPAGVRR